MKQSHKETEKLALESSRNHLRAFGYLHLMKLKTKMKEIQEKKILILLTPLQTHLNLFFPSGWLPETKTSEQL